MFNPFKMVLLILAFSGLANAQDASAILKIKEGLWEVKMKMDLEGMNLPQKMPAGVLEKMPPEQRERIAKMMNATHEPTVIKECITKEKLAKYQAFNAKHKDCTQIIKKASPNRYEATFTCNTKYSTTTGDMVVEAINAEHSRGTVRTSSNHKGKAIAANMTFDSRYLGSNCGSVN